MGDGVVREREHRGAEFSARPGLQHFHTAVQDHVLQAVRRGARRAARPGSDVDQLSRPVGGLELVKDPVLALGTERARHLASVEVVRRDTVVVVQHPRDLRDKQRMEIGRRVPLARRVQRVGIARAQPAPPIRRNTARPYRPAIRNPVREWPRIALKRPPPAGRGYPEDTPRPSQGRFRRQETAVFSALL